jgi:hypothetical protein
MTRSAHLLRHSLTADLLRRGAALSEIGEPPILEVAADRVQPECKLVIGNERRHFEISDRRS